MSTGILLDDVFLDHHAMGYHPEQPERLVAIRRELESRGLLSRCERVPPRDATDEEILRVHSTEYLERLKEVLPSNSGHLDPDTFFSPGSWNAALKACGGTVELALSVLSGKLDNGAAFVRPPGHHATRSRAMGFCILNNIAAAAAAALAKGAIRVAIVDWDLHHGNGTQDIFYSRSDLLYCSFHMFPHYPGTGRPDETGAGPGAGHTINLPLPPRSGFAEFSAGFKEVVLPVLDQFRPDLILVSTGFDAHDQDPLGALTLEDEDYGAMTVWIRQAADRLCKGKLVMVLEGGYDLGAISRASAAMVVRLLDQKAEGEAPEGAAHASPMVQRMINEVKRNHSAYWAF